MIPGAVEIGVLLANTLVGGILKIWANKTEIEAARHSRELELLYARSDIVKNARDYEGPKKSNGFHFTRRTIALLGIFFVICWPKIVPVFWKDIPVAVSYSQLSTKFWLFGEQELIKWVVAEGVAVTPLDTLVVMAILGLFMGSEIVKRR